MSTRIRLSLARPTGFRLALDLTLPEGGITALHGPSGSGKTTVLRCVAGLERAREALVEIAGECWQDDSRGVFLPTWRRPLGYVPQEAGLFEHLDVNGNLRFGLRRRHADEALLQEAIELLGIAPLLGRRVQQLSGGERQRVAIARALASAPRLLLLDEPLSALDAARKREVLPWLERLHARSRVPMLYVTHSADEVARLADTLVLMDAGRALACGPVQDVLLRTDLPAADEDRGVLLQGRVLARDARWQLARIGFPGGALWLPDAGRAQGEAVRVRVLARDVSLATEAPRATSVQNLLPCTVHTVAADARHAAQVVVHLHCTDDTGASGLLARITARAAHDLALAPGKAVWAQVKAAALVE